MAPVEVMVAATKVVELTGKSVAALAVKEARPVQGGVEPEGWEVR